MTKEKGRSTRRNSGLSERLTKLLSEFKISQKEGALLAVGGDGKPTRHSVFHSWCSGGNCTDYKALQSLCRSLSARGKEQICFEWLLTGESTPKPPGLAVLQNESDLAKLFLNENELFEGYLHVRVTKVGFKKNRE